MFRSGTRTLRPFAESAGVGTRHCSPRLQRAVTDLGADLPFSQAAIKLKEHYGVVLAVETVRRIVESHGQAIFESQEFDEAWPTTPGNEWVVVQTDGGMVPIVQTDAEQADCRKGKKLEWKELKLGLAYTVGSVNPFYGGTLTGGVDEMGRQLFSCACDAGFGANSQVHAVGDGASWIANQVDEKFGSHGHYLVDFYHACEYLSDAAETCAGADATGWLEQQKVDLKANRSAIVLAALLPYREHHSVPDEKAPVRRCYRYLSNRRHQLDYAGAIEKKLPIGSGKIESSHRYIVQQRLKRPGAWWSVSGAEQMLALRLCRANGRWEEYWQSRKLLAA